jgi:hypothetical protein
MDVADWLRALGLERYEAAFRENDVDAELLPNLTADDLKDLGVTSVGHRRHLLEAIAALRLKVRAEADPNQLAAGASTSARQSSLRGVMLRQRWATRSHARASFVSG